MSVKWYAPAYVERVRGATMRGVVTAIGIVERHAVHLIVSPPKTGRIYRRRGVEHQASAPGQAPATDTGGLAAGRRIQLDTRALRARLIFTKKAAWWLEHGTRKMEPRPFARRALYEKRRAVVLAIGGEVRTELGGGRIR
jgi:hypothetical protein